MLLTSIEIFLLVLAYMTLIFLLALVIKDNSIVDIAWGPGFIVIAFATLLGSGVVMVRAVLATILVVLWGLRLAVYIAARRKGRGEDWRYAKWRREWGKNFLWRSYLQIFVLQGLLMMLVASSLILINSSTRPGLVWLDGLGGIVWCIGFAFETAADIQMYRFKADPGHKGRILTRGVWSLSRHPNYFGEVLIWWGFFLITLSVPNGWLGILSPLTITFLLLRVSGVTMLEKKYRGNPEFEDYARRTAAFFPRPPKRNPGS